MAKRVRTLESFKFGQKNIVPYVGEVQFDQNGEFEVQDDVAAEKLVELGLKFEIIEENEDLDDSEEEDEDDFKQGLDEGSGAEFDEDDSEDEDGSEDELHSLEEVRQGLEEMTIKELKQTCVDGEYPAEEWKSLTKKDQLIDYIMTKIA